jgi:hypothetical protein
MFSPASVQHCSSSVRSSGLSGLVQTALGLTENNFPLGLAHSPASKVAGRVSKFRQQMMRLRHVHTTTAQPALSFRVLVQTKETLTVAVRRKEDFMFF